MPEAVPDRGSPAYAARLAEAAEMNAINPGLSEASIQRIRDTIPGVLDRYRDTYPRAPEAMFARAEAQLRAAIDDSASAMEAGLARYWATYYSVSDQRFLRQADDVPYLPTLLRRLRLLLTHWWLRGRFEQILRETDQTTTEIMGKAARQIDDMFKATKP